RTAAERTGHPHARLSPISRARRRSWQRLSGLAGRRTRPETEQALGTFMARALWKGSISFGLVNIPIELHTAIRDHRPKFRMLHAKDKSPVRFERVCISDGHAVAWEDLVKGYEYEKGRFVIVTKEDFKAAALEKTRTIDIIDFVKSEEIDDRFFETPYYLVPGKG